MRYLMFFAVTLTLAGLTLTSCDDNDCTKGMGSTVTVELELAEVNSIIANGSMEITLEQASEQRILAVGQQNIIDDLELDVNSGEWTIELKEKCYQDFDLTIRMFVPDIDRIEVNGSNNVVLNSFDSLDALVIETSGSGVIFQSGVLEIEDLFKVMSDGSANVTANFNAARTEIDIKGSGEVKFSGTTNDYTINISGAGDINSFGLESEECDIDISGSGDVELTANQRLDVRISGSGDVRYRGKPDVTTDISGSGQVIDAN